LTEIIVASARPAWLRCFLHLSVLGTRASATARYHQSKWAAQEMVRTSGLLILKTAIKR
jgi:NADH dehydrogenase